MQASDKARFEAEVRAAGDASFEIWQRDSQGKRLLAADSELYYPDFRECTLSGDDPSLGYDLGSEPFCRAMLEESARPGLATACVRPSGKGTAKELFLARPVFGQEKSGRLRGFVVAVLRPQNMLRGDNMGDSVFQQFSILHKDVTSESIASSWNANDPPPTGAPITIPLFAFGKVFAVTSYAGTSSSPAFPTKAFWLSLLGGLMLTVSMTGCVGLFLSRLLQQYVENALQRWDLAGKSSE